MLVKHHVVVSLSGGIIIYLLTQSFLKAILFSLAGIFIDIDHLFDYIHNFGWKIINLREFNKIFYTRNLKKLYVLLHSYELLTIFGFCLWYFKISWGWVVFLSLGIHLFMDQIYYLIHFREFSLWFYFLSFRIARKFEIEKFKTNSIRK